MSKATIIESLTGKTMEKKKSKLPALMDKLQSLTGAMLALFVLLHLLLESSILLGKTSMFHLSKFFEGSGVIEGGTPLFIIGISLLISVIFVLHAFLAMRKFPNSYREHLRFRTHAKLMKHPDTNLWFLQISTGFMLFFLGSIHLYLIMTQPLNIGPYASSDKIYSDQMWILYLMLLVSVVLHAGAGGYRLIMKWGWLDGDNPKANRIIIRKIIKVVTLFYLLMGLFSLGAYLKIGYEHQENYGKRYHLEEEL